MHKALLIVSLFVGACAALPDTGVPLPVAQTRSPYPPLIPMTRILQAAAPAGPALLGLAGTELQLARLREKARILRGAANSESDIDAMRMALARLVP